MKSILTMVGVLALLSLVPARAQSLAEAAKKAEEQRKAAAEEQRKTADPNHKAAAASEPKKVYTNKDLKDVGPSAATSTANATTAPSTEASPAAVSGAGAVGDKPADSAPVAKDEHWWRARMAGLRGAQVDAAKACVAKTTLVIRLQQVVDAVPDRGFSAAAAYAQSSSELAKARTDLDECRTNERKAAATIASAEEEARHLGVLPGWLR